MTSKRSGKPLALTHSIRPAFGNPLPGYRSQSFRFGGMRPKSAVEPASNHLSSINGLRAISARDNNDTRIRRKGAIHRKQVSTNTRNRALNLVRDYVFGPTQYLSAANRRAYEYAMYNSKARSLEKILRDMGARNAKRLALKLYTMNRVSKQKIVNILTN